MYKCLYVIILMYVYKTERDIIHRTIVRILKANSRCVKKYFTGVRV